MREQLLAFISSLKSDKEKVLLFDEAATKNALILRCLSLLGWDIFNVDEVSPEYSVGKLSVDYSLRIDNANKVFVEVKRVREDLENHQEQLLSYSFKQGINLAILTNGIAWWFYLPLLEGDWEQRKFYTIDVFQQEAEDIASKFRDFLARENIARGKAVDNAKAVLESQQRRKKLQETLPQAWNMIVSEPDGLLVDLINETAEKICGFKADDNMIMDFLTKHEDQLLVSAAPLTEVTPITVPDVPPITLTPLSEDYTGKKISSFYFSGEKYQAHSWRGLLLGLCEVINTEHRTDFSKVLTVKGRKRSYFARDENQFLDPKRIPNTDIFVEANQSANSAIRLCQRLIALFGYSDDNLRIELKIE